MHPRSIALLLTGLLLGTSSASSQSFTACQSGSAGNYSCDAVDLYALVPTGTSGPLRSSATNDVWGWTDPETNREYALTGTRSGTVFVDITDPNDPQVLGKLPTQTDNSTWRDIKTYGHYAFVVSEAGGHGMQVFDLTRLRGLTADPNRDFTADAVYSGFGNAHNLVINEDSGFAYGVGTSTCAGGLHMVDIRDPLNPVQAGCFSADGYTHDAQCVVYDGPDADYTGREICMAANEDNVAIVDVTDKANPSLIAHAHYDNPRYTHQGWFTEDKRYFIVNDELDNNVSNKTRTIVLNVEDLDDPEFAFFYLGPLETTDHNLYVRGHYAYLSNYEGGLRILDLSGIDAGVLTEVASFDTYWQGDNESFNGQWSNYPFFPSGTVIATDQNNGLFILKPNLQTTGVAAEAPGPDGFTLSAPAPNPASGRATMTLTVAEPQTIRAEVYDLAGRRVAVLFDGPAAAGSPVALRVDGEDLPAGLYLVRVTGEHFTTTRRLSLVR